MLIHNYGFFWSLSDVFWGRGGLGGRMLGVRPNGLTDEPIDFREQSGVYVLYADYQMIYVGQAGHGNHKLFNRLKQHTRDALARRWDQFSWFGTRRVNMDGTLAAEAAGRVTTHKEVLNHIEAILIHAAEPPHNRQGGRFGSNVQQYLQVRDDNLGPTAEVILRELWDRSQK